ncbi:MAG TPA: hypothetical protein VFA85_05180 [Terriglobales bacterium]|nr:hypothetical protein [Terriglobales bacterium]
MKPEPATDLPAEQIRAQIAKASAALHRILPDAADAGSVQSINLADLRVAFAEVMRTGKLLTAYHVRDHCALPAAFDEYQRLLRQFRSKLPQFQGWLLTERARLANRRSHSAAVESWIQTNRQTRRNH